jgi:hypothetical protein
VLRGISTGVARRAIIGVVLCLGLAVVARSAAAEEFTAGGLQFSDELGGFRLISVSGSGSVSDPIVVVEEVNRVGDIVLVIRGQQMIFSEDKPPRKAAFVNLAVIKVVINATDRVWTGFDLELQEELRKPSPYEDGLSFDQLGSFSDEPFTSDSFSLAHRMPEPYDRVQFYDGSVDPGAAVRFNLFITDPTPALEFYLLQEPHLIVAGAPAPGVQVAHSPAAAAR